MRLTAKTVLLTLVALLLVCDVLLLVSGRKLLVGSKVHKVVIYQGDIILPATPARVGPDYSEAVDAAICTYWTGISLKQLGDVPGMTKCPGPIL